MTSTKNTAFVLVPGSFSPATYYEKVTPYLEADGYEALAVSLPSCNADDKRNERPATMLDDAAAISNVVSKLADKGKNVVVAMHSYGGFPGTESSKGLSKAERQQQSKEGGIVALVYLAAWLPTEGMSTYQMSGEPDVVKNAGDYVYFDNGEMYKYIFPELPEEEAKAYTAQLENHSTISFHGMSTYAGYKHIPSTCLIPENDLIIPTEKQKALVAAAEAEGAKLTVISCEAGHVPLLGIPEKVAEVLINAANVT